MDILNNEYLLSWLIGTLLVIAFTIPYLIKWRKKHLRSLDKLDDAIRSGSHKAMMQHPIIDLTRCIGCGICTKVCPEGEVLGLIGGKAVLINGRKCVGHEVCKESCPVGGIEVGLGDISSREDIPKLTPLLESNLDDVFIIGELGGLALIRNAINQGVRVAATILDRFQNHTPVDPVVIVGGGPAGLACAISLMDQNIPVILIDQNEPGGTILQYPRRKLVMVQPVDFPGYGEMTKKEYSKEALLDIWAEIFKKYNPDFRSGHQLLSLSRVETGYKVNTSESSILASYVVLALGRRGTPRKLGVPGEELSKVAYKLIDAESYKNHHILVVGGGDSAVEAAVGLGQQTGNTVTLSYRKGTFSRIKSRNEEQLNKAIKQGWVRVLYNSQVTSITEHNVYIDIQGEPIELPNQNVFIFAGGIPPFDLMNTLGVDFGTSTIS